MTTENIGTIRSVRGSVVDVHFPRLLPDIYSRLVTDSEPSAEIEVISHLD
jgi:F-type H+-transporting ATPase subunit beta